MIHSTVSAYVIEFTDKGEVSSLPPSITNVKSNSVNPSNKENPDYIIVSGRKYSVGDVVVYTFGHKKAKIEKFIENKHGQYSYDVEIRFLNNNKIKLTTLEYIE